MYMHVQLKCGLCCIKRGLYFVNEKFFYFAIEQN